MTTATEDTRMLIGDIGVDTGTCWIGDPCYIKRVDAAVAGEGDVYANAWDDPGDRVDVAGMAVAKRFPIGPDHPAFGIAVMTGYGDGNYPVYARVTPEGRVASITVEFLSDEEDGDDDESPAPDGPAVGPAHL
jgi:hypothetical protein